MTIDAAPSHRLELPAAGFSPRRRQLLAALLAIAAGGLVAVCRPSGRHRLWAALASAGVLGAWAIEYAVGQAREPAVALLWLGLSVALGLFAVRPPTPEPRYGTAPKPAGAGLALDSLRGMVAAGILLTATVNLVAVGAIMQDESEHDDKWDGLGTAIGIFALAGLVPIMVASIVVLTLLYRRPSAGIRGALGFGWILCLVGLLWLLPDVNPVLGLLVTGLGAVIIVLGQLAGSRHAHR